MKKPDKSLREVWGWKEKVFQEYGQYSSREYIQKMKNNAAFSPGDRRRISER
jgi:hypothetical protein